MSASDSSVKLTSEQKFRAVACAMQSWDDASGNIEHADRLFRRRHGGCDSVLIWIQVAAALLQIAYTIWKWRQENAANPEARLPEGHDLEAMIDQALAGGPVPS